MSLLLALAGCTFAPGSEGFTTVAEASLAGALEGGDALDATLTLDEATLTLGDLSLQAIEGGAVDFDPAAPPEGYTLCHGGHCHRDDGALVDYADILIELSGGAATFTEVARFEGEHRLDLLSGAPVALDGLLPSPHLPIVDITRVEAPFAGAGLHLLGTIELEGRALPLEIALAPASPLSGGLSLPVDRDQAPEVTIAFQVDLADGLLDGVDLSELVEGEAVRLDDPEHPLAAPVVERLLATELAGDADPLE